MISLNKQNVKLQRKKKLKNFNPMSNNKLLNFPMLFSTNFILGDLIKRANYKIFKFYPFFKYYYRYLYKRCIWTTVYTI